ncbi:siphovirus Gp157 family protein [Lacticaseibacillus saniviri]
MATLYSFNETLALLKAKAENSEIDEQVFADTLASLQGDLEEIADGLQSVFEDLDVTVAGYNGQIDELKKKIDQKKLKIQSIEKRKERMKEYLRSTMEAAGTNDLKTQYNHFYTQNYQSVVVDVPAEKLPIDTVTERRTLTPNKAALKKWVASRGPIDGVTIQTTTKLQIR